ncbi:MAG: purine-binding chemotaxis protein CheW [Trebonia sp.]|nr:purine-binding chemotaxis protein CheW [Trebonia sp.]
MRVYVRLRIASETYAMPVEHVLGVADIGQIRAVPRARPELLGLWNRRGRILPVVDLARLLGVTRTGPPERVLIAEARGHQACFAIDDVSQIGELEDPAEETESDLLAGATLADGDLVGVIDVPRAFDSLEGLSGERP